MSQALLSRVSQVSAPRHLAGSEPASRRAETEAVLRDLAFVLHLTQRVKSSITAQEPEGPARRSR